MGNINMIMAKHESMINAWRERVMECKTSGLTVAEWCERNHINKKTYFYWQKQVWDKATNAIIPNGQSGYPQAQPIQFAQVNLVPDNPTTDSDIVIRKDSWTVEIRNTANAALLSIVLQAVTGGV